MHGMPKFIPRMILNVPIKVRSIAMIGLGMRTFQLLCAIKGMINMAGSVPIPKAVMERMEVMRLPLAKALLRPR